ncbi:hypothetical protein I8920_04410 [Curtobacterium sp. YC1]|uniref:alpha/beta hydrolase n=1 Tax=Curtobacterium sp. YC1 TaxID=2795488 RepID=UPI0018E554EF|nr:alpha/beta hydrolase [Curtobacterium sp. YC1]QQD77000.1 hypothetical protein I8920_04410 [Curtobacterium sp. YC1]
MLLVAAALLTASMHSLGVVEVPDVPPAHAAPAAVAVVAPRHPAPVPVATGGHTGVEDVATAGGRAFLDGLGALDADELGRAAADRRVVETVQDDPPSAATVARWWVGLHGDERDLLLRCAPSVVGNLDGVPYAVRDVANRATLMTGLADDDTGAAEAAMLGQVRDSLVHEPGDPQRYLVTLDTRGSGRAAISIGDLDTAADVTVVVPGMFFTVTGQMTDFTDTANDLSREQATLAPLATAGGGSGSGVAVVAWMGYRTPDLSNILSLGLAETGAVRLERAVDGLRERPVDPPRLNVVAHSYGSTTAMIALASGRMTADTLTVLGSPGSDVRSAADLAVTDGEVFVGGAHSDPIAGSGYFGTDPGGASFGSTVLDLAGGVQDAAGDVFRRPVGHNDYLEPGTASLHDVALIGIGRGDLVREQVRRGDHDGDSVVGATPDMYLVRPQDLQPRD